MEIWKIVVCAAVSVCMLAVYIAFRRSQDDQDELADRRDEGIRKAIASMAQALADALEGAEEEERRLDDVNDKTLELEARLGALEARLRELPLEELEKEAERAKRWNDGVENILGYGPDVPKLNKGAAKRS